MKNYKSLSLLLCLLFMVTLFSKISVEARNNHTRNSKSRKHQKDKSGNGNTHFPSPAPASLPHRGSNPNPSSSFDLFSFGAKGDGVSDDSKALLATWKAACNFPGATVEIPSGFNFLIKPITLQGPCMPHLVLQIDGTLLAPPRVGSWPKSSLFQWINFKWVQNFTIQGTGTVDGQGSNWWTTSQILYTQKKSNNIPVLRPTALRFYSSYDVTVSNIKIVNSPQCHLKFDSSKGVKVNNITISSPEDSLNTDGIHLQNTQDVEIQHSSIGCGDDCVSIQTGCSNVQVHHINCGPGHGIRNDCGQWISGFTRRIGVTNSFMAELWGLREGLMLCCNLNIASVIVELDARAIVDAISNDQYVNNVISPVLDDCRVLISRFHRILFKHCYREANCCADSLARRSISQEIDFISYESPPVDVLKTYEDDCNGVYLSSLGGLGKDKSVACVSNIIVENISIQNTLSGVRIKTWQGGIGSVKNVSFTNVQVSDVKVPIIIDQFYCDKNFCKNQTGAVAITGVKYDQIIGTYSVRPIHLACSNDIPCTGIDLIDIQLKPSPRYRGFQQGLCLNSYGKSSAPLVPSSIDYCLSNSGGSVNRIARSHDNVC